ncbi:MAG: HYR domain-containing protein [Haliscomenobacteraceae bacterium CHB4]|nr:HYR domain-containing protein [Haliscomenobacteraceae bacterium CHB4]
MRFFLFLCLLALLQASGLANTPISFRTASFENPAPNFPIGSSPGGPYGESFLPILALTLDVDSIHHVNCLRPTGYLSVVAEGGVPAYTYNWSNGLTGPVATSLAPGVYSITVTDDVGATAVVNATILQDLTLPSANAGADFVAQCSNSSVNLNGSGSAGPEFTYQWVPSAGGTIQSGANTLNPVISHTGIFTLVVSNTANGCSASDAVTVGAAFQPPAAVATGGTITCAQHKVTLNANFNPNNIIYFWQGPGGFTSYQLNPQVGIPGAYTFVLTDTITTCTGNASTTVAIDTVSPTATAGGGGVLTCAQTTVGLTGAGSPAGVTFAWTGPNGYTSSLQNPDVDAPGTYVLTVTKPQNGCTATSSVGVTANTTPPIASASVNGVLTCVVNSVQLSGNGSPAGVSFSWAGPLGFSSNTQNPVVFAPGAYTLTVKNPQNGCTATASVTVISNTTLPGVTASGGIKTCANPTVTLNASSPTQGVSYAWSGSGGFSSNLQNPVVSQAGTYSVTVTNPVNGCVSHTTVSVTQNLTPPNILANTTTVTCNNPNPQVVASSQTNGATFSWTGPNGFTANIPNPHVSEGGIYTVTATSPANGCTSFISIYVNENTTPPFVYAGEDRSLNCIFTSILANPIGTSTGNNFTYQWTTWDGHIVSGANTLYARFDTAGHYTLTVKNTQNGCTAADSMEVTQSPPVTANASQLSAVTCNGGNNGSAKATGGGGNGVYNYAWSNGAQTATANNLAAGTYTVTVTDGETCSATTTVTIAQPPALQANVTTTPQTIAGQNNGSAAVAPSGGTPPYTVKWSTGATTLNIGMLAPGTYTVTVTDNKGCTQVNTATVNAVACNLTGTVDATHLNCFGVNNGAATVNISGAIGTVNYLWSNGANTKTATNLAAGDYTVTATAANGCSITLSTQITSPQQIVLSIANQTNVLCASGQTGSVTIGVSGGTSPYNYTWSNGNNSVTASNLGVGSYTFTVTDANGCTQNQSVQITATDNTPPQLTLKSAAVSLDASGQATVTPDMFDDGSTDNCGIVNWAITPTTFDCGQTGTRTVTLTATDQNGNTATATATVTVTDDLAPVLACPQNISVSSCNAAATYSLPQVTDNCTVSGDPILQSGLPSGTVFPAGATEQVFAYTDLSGNTGTCSFTVTVLDNISVAVSATPVHCGGACDGSVTLDITGGSTPITVSWTNGQTGNSLTGLCPGDYEATLTDASGCSVTQSVQIAVEDTEAPALTCPSNVTTGFCNATVTFALPQATDNCPVDPQQIELIAGQASGTTFPVGTTTETYRYTDFGGNTAQCSFTVTVHPQLDLTVNSVNNDTGSGTGSISITLSGGAAPYTYAWTRNGQPFAVTEDLFNLFSGQYAVTVTDADGCTVASTSLTVSGSVSAGEPADALSWVLYPNPATSEVYLKINDVLAGPLRLSIFDAGGRLLREQEIQISGADAARIGLDGLPEGLLLFRLAGEQASWVKMVVKTE